MSGLEIIALIYLFATAVVFGVCTPITDDLNFINDWDNLLKNKRIKLSSIIKALFFFVPVLFTLILIGLTILGKGIFDKLDSIELSFGSNSDKLDG